MYNGWIEGAGPRITMRGEELRFLPILQRIAKGTASLTISYGYDLGVVAGAAIDKAKAGRLVQGGLR